MTWTALAMWFVLMTISGPLFIIAEYTLLQGAFWMAASLGSCHIIEQRIFRKEDD